MRAPVFATIALLLSFGGALLAAGGCAPDEPVSPSPVPADAGVLPEAGTQGTPLAPEVEPEPFVVPSWMRTVTANPSQSDPVRLELEDGTFTVPTEEGKRDDGTWKIFETDENGGLGTAGTSALIYAAATIDVPQGRHVFARADRVLSVWTNNVEAHPGDPYASGRMRVPLAGAAGANIVVVRATTAYGGEPQIALFSTTDELVFNRDDMTLPDLVVGEAIEQWAGVPVLNVTNDAAHDLAARVEESDHFQATTVTYPSLPAGGVTQIAFRLIPKKPFAIAGEMITVGLRLESPSLAWAYRREIQIATVAAGATHKRSFRSGIDGSAQYYGVVPPSNFAPGNSYAMVLTLHGAAVEAIGQAQAYSPKDWAYIVAATNRRPYGFDWESFGRRDAIEVLDKATAAYGAAQDRVYLTGHSMGGHGTWNLGVLFPGRFATIGPSAGWGSYYSYAGLAVPTGAFARSQASSDTLVYLENLAKRGAYVIHGSADDNVPVSEAHNMVDAVSLVTDDVLYHEEPGAGHWWDGEASPGADCVDWPPLFDFMKAHTLDPYELDFHFITASTAVNPKHSYVTLRSQLSAYQDTTFDSVRTGDTVTLTTTNARSLEISGAALAAAGVTTLVVDGTTYPVDGGPIAVGPQEGKYPGAGGPFDEVFYQPFCFVYPDDGPPVLAWYASHLLANWQIIGNGQGVAVPLSRVTGEIRSQYNLVYLGVPAEKIAALAGLPIQFGDAITVAGVSHSPAGIAFVFPENGRLSAAIMTTPGSESMVYRFQPFRSAYAPPDYMVFGKAGVEDAGYFTPDWKAIEVP